MILAKIKKERVNMRNKLLILSSLLIVPASMAFAADSATTNTTDTDAMGTTTKTSTTRSTSTGASGIVNSNETESTVVDPKGMLNTTSVDSRSARMRKPDGDYSDSKTVKHADGSSESVAVSKNSAKHWTNDGKTTTTSTTRTLDPVGLGNKQTSEVTETVERNPDGSGSRKITSELNGETVSEETKPLNR